MLAVQPARLRSRSASAIARPDPLNARYRTSGAHSMNGTLLLHRPRCRSGSGLRATPVPAACCSPVRSASAKALGVSFAARPLPLRAVGLVAARRGPRARARLRRYSCCWARGAGHDPDAERAGPQPLAAALAGLGYGAGAVLFAGTLARARRRLVARTDRRLLAAVALAQRAVLPVFARARARLADGAAKQALSLYLDAALAAARGARRAASSARLCRARLARLVRAART